MREVKLPWVFAFVGEITQANVEAGAADREIAQVNAQRVISAAVLVEKELEKIINARIVGEPIGEHPFFVDHVLSADWFTFSAKRKVALAALYEFDHIKGEDKSRLEKLLRAVMSLRNRFAHGHLVARGNTLCISYFENKTCEDALTDEFWDDVERTFEGAIQLLAKGQKSMGIPVAWPTAG